MRHGLTRTSGIYQNAPDSVWAGADSCKLNASSNECVSCELASKGCYKSQTASVSTLGHSACTCQAKAKHQIACPMQDQDRKTLGNAMTDVICDKHNVVMVWPVACGMVWNGPRSMEGERSRSAAHKMPSHLQRYHKNINTKSL